MGGGGGQTQNQTSTKADQTTLTATGTIGDVANVAGGSFTSNVLDAGAITGSLDVAGHALDAGTANLANLINFAAATESGAADLIAKAIGLSATAIGANNNTVKELSGAITPVSSVSNQVSPIDLAKIVPWIVGGVAVYVMFKRK